MSNYRELLRDRASVAHLLKHVSASDGDDVVPPAGRWVAPMDTWKVQAAHSVLDKVVEAEPEGTSPTEGENVQTGGDDASVVSGATTLASTSTATDAAAVPKEQRIDSLAKLQRTILHKSNIPLETKGTSLITSAQSLSSKRVMMDLRPPDMQYPTAEGIPPCPEAKVVERAFLDNSLSIEVHSVDGYSFTSEFELVYKGKSSNASAYGDYITVCKRALLTLDPTFDDELGARYARLIARMCLWERTVAAEVCAKALRDTAPHLCAEMMEKEPYAPLKIFIGKDSTTGLSVSESVVFWMRYCPRIQPRSLDRSANNDIKVAEKKAHIAMQLCSYRRVSLNMKNLEVFETWCDEHVEAPAAKLRSARRQRYIADRERKMAGKKRTPLEDEPSAQAPAPPLPAPFFPPKKGTWGLHLFCRQNYKALSNEGNLDLYDDDAEEEQMWSNNAYQAFNATPSAASEGATASAAASASAVDVQRSDLVSVASSADSVTVDTRNTLKRRMARALASDPSACSELIGWGHDTDFSLGIGAGIRSGAMLTENIHTPRPVPIPASLALERVKSIACSPRHTLVLSCLGNLYVCGENSEGALGLGDMRSRNVLTLLQWPQAPGTVDAPPRIAKVSAGSGSIGSHSMCIDVDGKLYGWGVPQAVGLGSMQTVLSPKLIDTFPRQAIGRRADGEGSDNDQLQQPLVVEEDFDEDLGGTPCALLVKDVSCGGGFTVCVLRDGRVCSWGTWQHGRLGLGATPNIKSARGYGSGEKLARYKLRPSFVRGIHNAVQVSCGEAHAMCVLESGEVKAWGQNSCGQLGLGPNYMGYLRDALRPAVVPPFTGNTREEHEHDHKDVGVGSLKAKSVCAGPYHSCIIDTKGRLWSFGARGSACLGHNDPFLTGDWADRLSTIFAIATNALQTMIPFEILAWVRSWSVPRQVLSLSEHRVVQVVAGDQSTGVLTDDGHFLLCGTGAVSPPIVSASLEQDARQEVEDAYGEVEGEGGDDDVDGELSDPDFDSEEEVPSRAKKSQDTLLERARARHEKRKEKKKMRDEMRAGEQAKLVASKATLVKSFRQPSASWLPELASRRAMIIASSGTRFFAVLDEENVASTLTTPLLKSTLRPGGGMRGNSNSNNDDDQSTDAGDAYSVGSYFDVRGRADCILVVSGKMILCHRAVLSARSNELRDMIAQETPSDDYSVNSEYYSQQPTQLLLPELHVDSARALLSFIYTDVLPTSCIGNVSMLQSLERVSRSLRMPRLQVVCERLLDNLTMAEMARNDDLTNAEANTATGASASMTNMGDMPPPTLARDLGTLVGDAEFADVRFIAEGRAIPAHRFILESRCEYFRAMFRYQSAAGVDGSVSAASRTSTNVGMVDVVVPDSFVAFLRMLIFIYTDTLPDGNDEALLEDLLSADRYDIKDMKSMCESMLVPSQQNWLGLLKVAELVRSRKLLNQVHGFLRDNFSTLNEVAEAEDANDDQTYLQLLRTDYPVMAAAIFKDRLLALPPPPSQMLVTQMEANHAAAEKADGAPPFPIWVLVLGVIFAFLYAQLSNIISLGPMVPIVNTAFLGGGLFWAYRRLFFK